MTETTPAGTPGAPGDPRDQAFTAAEWEYLASQRLGRLATVDPRGQPQNNPVGFFPQQDGTILVGGYALGTTKKWRNLQAQPRLALVVDDIVSFSPWQVRGVEVRGVAELREGPHGLGPHFSDELIVVHPRRVLSWGLEEA
ncbi:PPOX class F420-dependent oxidoreductase [Streptomyces qinglanensis]|uniref:Pyridoxamine 5'-phosphate oxidase family protein n=1 Tax=Streptomyces qinglanensis TaxID=943816 RepID=A0A1H9RYR1_9ACTN|nr:PPOX class F420-dependent oxidoreductase [Streptomyces qinglanensis]SER77922.1 pyridoxamine 5'-phosphate oxidase family protein [Streptomyces qinglanensis]